MRSTHSASATRLLPIAAALLLGGTLSTAYATNGMLMEGYGPIATGMGGASQAIDHGNAGMAQNPATLGMMADGTARLDLAVGVLGPDVSSEPTGMPTMVAKSGGTSYLMPALGYTRRSGSLTYGLGVFAQGGMGTEYGGDAFLANPGAMLSTPVMTNLPVRSELGVGNVIFPVAMQVNPNLTVGAALKFMWSSLDMQMTASGSMLGQMANASGVAPTGNLAAAMPALGGANWARISFSDNSDFTGAAKSTGMGFTFGGVYKTDERLTVGASYQLKSSLSDMKTSAAGASMSAEGGFVDNGRITVIDFQMPSVASIGASWKANPELTLAADLKHIGWSSAMKSFKMQYESAQLGGTVNFAMDQQWKDQTVLNLGMAYKANQQLTLRAGLSLADNPVSDTYVNPLFPAIVRNHVTLGMGYQVTPAGQINASLTMAPKVTVSSPQGMDISHSQTNVQLMYSHSF